jgi:hypothetical protein
VIGQTADVHTQVADLLQQLRHRPTLRRMPAESIVVKELAALLRDEALIKGRSSEARSNVFWVFREMGEKAKAALPQLQKIMRDNQSPSAGLAALAVHGIDPTIEVGPRLSELLNSKFDENRNISAQHLRDFVSPEAAQRLLTERLGRETKPIIKETIEIYLDKRPQKRRRRRRNQAQRCPKSTNGSYRG